MYVFIKCIIEKTNCYWQFYSIRMLLQVSEHKRRNNFEHVISITHKQNARRIFRLKKWIIARRLQSN